MAKKVYIADLDAHIVSFTKKIDDATRQTLDASAKMTNAFNRVTAAMEKDMQKSSTAVRNFSKRDLGMLTTQLFATIGASGKLGSQLSNLASGLLMGGTIGAAFAGFSAILNSITSETNKWSDALKTASGQLLTFKSNFDKIKFEVGEENIGALMKATEESIAAMELKMAKPFLETTGFSPFGRGAAGMLMEIDKIFQSVGAGSMVLTKEQEKQLSADRIILENLEEQKLKYEAMNMISERLTDLGATQVVDEKKVTAEKEKQKKILEGIISSEAGISLFDQVLRDAQELRNRTPSGTIISSEAGEDVFDTVMRDIKEVHQVTDETQDKMGVMVSLSNQMASNFHFAGHTLVGQLSQAIAMVDSISNIILTIASLAGAATSGFGLGGLLSLIGLEKGGRVTNRFGSLSLSQIPSFASGGSYSTPAFSGPFGGGYPVMVHKNETLDVYNSGQSSRLEKIMMSVKDAIVTSNIHLSKRGRGGGGVTVINLDGKTIAKAVQKNINKMEKSNYRLAEL